MSSKAVENASSNGSDESAMGLRSTPEIGAAMRELPRSEFVGFRGGIDGLSSLPIELGNLPTSAALSAVLGAANPQPNERFLEVGLGLGYSTAILAKLVKRLDVLDASPGRIEQLEQLFVSLGLANVEWHIGELPDRLQADELFDGIIVAQPVESVPERFVEQLAVGGRMSVVVKMTGRSAQVVRIHRTEGGRVERRRLGTISKGSRIGDLLVDFGVLPRPRIEQEAIRARRRGISIGEALLEAELLDQETLYHVLALQFGRAFSAVPQMLHGATTKYFEELSQRYMRHNRVLPVKKVGTTMVVATTNPAAPMDDLRTVLDAEQVKPYVVTPTSFHRIWEALESGRIGESLETEPAPSPASFASSTTDPEKTDIGPLAGDRVDNAYVHLVDTILFDAADERASDIHFEQYEGDVRVRFRIDGDLHTIERYNLTPRELRGIVNVVKITANLDIAERRLPQGGRFSRRIEGRQIDLRVQTQPALEGEFCVIRLLPQDEELLTIDELGFPPTVAEQYRRLVKSPNGLILVVGPTGSGKSTTLYAGLQTLASDVKKKVITVEDPVEYTIRGVQQVTVKPKIGFRFSSAVRSFVRQDPDVLMVGEIRDKETALEAIRASQTGHLVLSTLHCNDSVDAIQRLFDLDMHANSIASELIGVFAQRLAKRICTHCRAQKRPNPEIVDELFPAGPPDDFVVYGGRGCGHCGGSGERGRVAVVEALPIGPTLRRSISSRLPLDDLREQALDAGLSPLRESALRLVREGVIPLSELPRILSVEAMRGEAPSGH
ncbi:MAG: ATPase, T2SS/T4P/T4SS family [Persicimonas sp.]